SEAGNWGSHESHELPRIFTNFDLEKICAKTAKKQRTPRDQNLFLVPLALWRVLARSFPSSPEFEILRNSRHGFSRSETRGIRKNRVRWRTMLKRVLTCCSALSLLLCITTAVLWVRSFYQASEFSIERQGSVHKFESWSGGIWCRLEQDWPDLTNVTNGNYEEPAYHRDFLGFVSSAGREGRCIGIGNEWSLSSTYCRSWRLPYWSLAVLTGVLSIRSLHWLITKRQHARRSRLGHCRQCGYDLRASRERCP